MPFLSQLLQGNDSNVANNALHLFILCGLTDQLEEKFNLGAFAIRQSRISVTCVS